MQKTGRKAHVKLVRSPYRDDSIFPLEPISRARQRAESLATLHGCAYHEEIVKGVISFVVDASEYYKKGAPR